MDIVDQILADHGESELAHFGVKGMHWGIRKTPEQKQQKAEKKARKKEERAKRREARRQERIKRADQRFEDDASEFSTKIDLHNDAGDLMDFHGDLDRINAKSEYIQAAEHGVLLKPDHPVTQKYEKEYMDAYVSRLNEAADNWGTNASGTRKYAVDRSEDFLGFTVKTVEVEHVADIFGFKVEFIKDEKGFITGSKIVKDTITQGALFVEDYLEHHGVKGQKWGVRRSKEALRARNEEARKPKPVTVVEKRKGSKREIQTKGGENQPIHKDAVKARTVQQQAKKSGLDTLSDQQLRDYATRLDLEQRVKRLEAQDQHGKSFIQKWMANKKNREATVKVLTDKDNQEAFKKISTAIKTARTLKKVAT